MIFRFGDGYELDTGRYELRDTDEVIHVEPQVFDVLAHLVENHTRVVSKEELLDEIWGNRFVSESALTTRLKAARQAVGDDGKTQALIRTVHGRGYQFHADVRATVEAPPAPGHPAPAGIPRPEGTGGRRPRHSSLAAHRRPPDAEGRAPRRDTGPARCRDGGGSRGRRKGYRTHPVG